MLQELVLMLKQCGANRYAFFFYIKLDAAPQSRQTHYKRFEEL